MDICHVEFKQMEIQNRWGCGKQYKLCFRCLGNGHLEQFCNRTRVCGINNCKEVHHPLLHKDQNHQTDGQKMGTVPEKKEVARKQEVTPKTEDSPQKEGESREETGRQNETYTTVTSSTVDTTDTIALRIIPVFLKNGNRKIKVNALLDDASTKTYINSDVVAELGLQEQLQKVNVSVLNGHIETFKTSPVKCTIKSLDRQSRLKITAFTMERVTWGYEGY